MIDKSKLINSASNPQKGYNILKDPVNIDLSSTYSSSMPDGDVTNFIINSNLENENLIK
ncbi:MAG: hypothetical protein RSD13_03395 [Clostridium sp.]|uniref:hypothetical protein n=1 Tax=Clostridium sp. TaxID=1506 RepID=UPI002FC62259